jgi:hydroxymethylpyrimidine/phosphomethylpyrimidine kinase
MHDCALAMRYSLAQACLVKGGHLQSGDDVIDIFCDEDGTQPIIHPRLDLEAHGTGCTLASAIAANLCLGLSMPAAAQAAGDYVERALRLGYRPGRGEMVVLDHFGATPHPRR